MIFQKEIKENINFKVGREILVALEEKGFKAFFVGGCVRDLILNIEPNDIDISTNAPIELVEELFETHNIGKSKDFGIVVVNLKGIDFEVAQFRVDSKETNGRKPNEVFPTDSFQEDVKRRDFTINALGLDKFGRVIDFVKGIDDIKNGIIRTVGDPVERFEEDHLRMLRAVRFSARFGFDIENKTFGAIRMLKEKVDLVSKERIKSELFKMASGDGVLFERSIQLLDKVRLLEIILPEIKALQDVQEQPEYHPEAWLNGDGTSFVHVMEALKQNSKEDVMINLSILFHDIGKALTHELDFREKFGEFRHKFNNHGEVGVEVIEKVSERLKFSSHEKDILSFVSKHHMTLFHCWEMKKSTIAKYTTHEFFPILKEVMFCDSSCRGDMFDVKEFDDKIKHMEKIRMEWKTFTKNDDVKIVSGNDVMEVTGLKPSPVIGQIIKEVSKQFLDSEKFVCLKSLILKVSNDM